MPVYTLDCAEIRKLSLEQAIVAGLPTLPSYVFELNTLLDAPAVDLRRVAQLIRTDPSLTAQVLRICYTMPFAAPVERFEDAVIIAGIARLRALALTCALVESVGPHLSTQRTHSYWRQSLLIAMIAERLAEWCGYPDAEKAYLTGLLHHIGELLSLGEREPDEDRPHHTEIGRAIVQAWNYPADVVEAYEYHDDPESASIDPQLCGIVAFADRYVEHRGLAAKSRASVNALAEVAAGLLNTCLPRLPFGDACRVAVALEQELSALLLMLDREPLNK